LNLYLEYLSSFPPLWPCTVSHPISPPLFRPLSRKVVILVGDGPSSLCSPPLRRSGKSEFRLSPPRACSAPTRRPFAAAGVFFDAAMRDSCVRLEFHFVLVQLSFRFPPFGRGVGASRFSLPFQKALPLLLPPLYCHISQRPLPHHSSPRISKFPFSPTMVLISIKTIHSSHGSIDNASFFPLFYPVARLRVIPR